MTCGKRQRADSGWPAGVFWGFLALGLLSPGFAGETTDSAEPGPLEQALATVQDYMARSASPWPDAWRQEYVQTIRKVVASRQETADFGRRLAILRNGFGPYWEGLKKTQERSLFEVHCAEIRWYVESLMDANLRGPQERHTLRSQYEGLFHYAASALLTQFPFLDPNAVHKAEADHMAQCYQRIEAPLLPIYLHPFSLVQLEQIKQRWHDLRYARVDMWGQLAGDDTARTRDVASSPEHAKPLHEHPDYLLTRRSLTQLQGQFWGLISPAPEYWRSAVANHIATQRRRVQSESQSRAEERRLEREYSRQIFHAEQIAFLLAALLETPGCYEEGSSVQAEQDIPPTMADGLAEGGGAHGGE